MFTSASLSMMSMNDLNRPEYDIVKVGETAMMPSAPVTTSTAFFTVSVSTRVTIMLAMSAANSRSSTTLIVTVWPLLCSAFAVPSASRSASILVDDGSLRPAAMTARL